MSTTKVITQLVPHGQYKKWTMLILMTWVGVTLLLFGVNSQSRLFPTVVKNMFIQPDAAVRVNILQPHYTTVDNNQTTNSYDCRGFDYNPDNDTTEEYFTRKRPIRCSARSPNFLYVTKNGRFLKINRERAKKLKVSVDYCKYTSLKRKNFSDFKVSISRWSKSFTESISLPAHVEHIWGKCFHKRYTVGKTFLSIVRKKKKLEKILQKDYKTHVKKVKPKETLSVLMMGIDGTSKFNLARQMPKTKSFVLNQMAGIEMYKLNKVGLNTFPNIVPLLTGKNSTEIRQNWTDKDYFDKIDHWFLWDEARLAGYRTSVILDRPYITSFHYVKQGWYKPKFHYYNRPLVVRSYNERRARSGNNYCIGDRDEINVYYDYWLQLTRVFNNTKTTPYFGYSFFAHVTHDDINMAGIVDDAYLELFQKLHGQKALNNTLVVFFSDHGNRYGKFRSTFRGMLEDSNPFMFFIFPPWFQSKYPKIAANFRKNQHRVMTNFDVHATLKDVLYFQGDDVITRNNGKRTRGLSLFQELPVTRTCEEAGIPIKFCNCRKFTDIGISSEVSKRVSKQFLKEVIAKTDIYRDKCVVLSLNTTQSMMAIFTTSTTHDFFQAQIKTLPGKAVYEATLKMKKVKVVGKEHSGEVSLEGDIQRVNTHNGQAACIRDARIRSYCYCRSLIR